MKICFSLSLLLSLRKPVITPCRHMTTLIQSSPLSHSEKNSLLFEINSQVINFARYNIRLPEITHVLEKLLKSKYIFFLLELGIHQCSFYGQRCLFLQAAHQPVIAGLPPWVPQAFICTAGMCGVDTGLTRKNETQPLPLRNMLSWYSFQYWHCQL